MTSKTTLVQPDRALRVTPVITTAADDWRAVIALCGEFDLSNAAQLRAELAQHIEAGRRVIRLDVAKVEFMDSTAIDVVVEASQQCRSHHGSLILKNVPARLIRVLTVTGLDTVLLFDNAGQS